MQEHAEYVGLAIATMRDITTYAGLVEWWKQEKANREKFKLSQHQWPGRDLRIAFDHRRAALKSQGQAS